MTRLSFRRGAGHRGAAFVAIVALAISASGCAFVARQDLPADGSPPVPGYNSSGYGMSDDGRLVLLWSGAPLVASDTNSTGDIYVRDNVAGTTERVSVTPGGGDPNGRSFIPSMSGDGRYVLFRSEATNLVPSTPAGTNLFIRDRTSHTTTLVDITNNDQAPDADVNETNLSNNGRVVTFTTTATNILPGGATDHPSVYVRDLDTATTERMDLGPGGVVANGDSSGLGLSGDGNIVAFLSNATNLTTPASPFGNSVWVRNRTTDTTQRVSVALDGGAPNASTGGGGESRSVTTDGRFVMFTSSADNLVPGDSPGTSDIFVRDLVTSTTSRVVITHGTKPLVMLPIALSDDARFLLILGLRTGLNDAQTYVIDRTRERIILAGAGMAQTPPRRGTEADAISHDGAYVLFSTSDPKLVPLNNGSGSGTFLRSTVSPDLSDVAPTSAPAGTTRHVLLTGEYLFAGATVSFGDGVTVLSTTLIDEQHADVTVQIAPNATPGPRRIIYQNAGTGAGPKTGGFVWIDAFSIS